MIKVGHIEGRASVPVVAGMVLASVGLAVLGFAIHDAALNANPDPAPFADAGAVEFGDGFPEVDWTWWQKVNPDVIGWVTVPGTGIDYPIVQAHEDAPDYYLTHGVDGMWSVYGCPYLTWQCAQGGLLSSANALVYGHHMRDGSMFAAFASFADAGYAQAHASVLLQTPTAKTRLEVLAVECVDASVQGVSLDAFDGVENMVTFCTCSYSTWADERTLVHCVVEETG